MLGGGDAAYYAYSTTGTFLWRHGLNVGSAGFAWASPLLLGARAYIGVAAGCDDPSVRGELRALDLATGSQQAHQYFIDPPAGNAGVLHAPAGTADLTTVVVTTADGGTCDPCPYAQALVTLDAPTLTILQADQQGQLGADLDYGTSPIIFHDAQGRTLVGAGHKDDYFYTYVLSDVNAGPLWARATSTSWGEAPASDPSFGPGGTLFIAANNLLYAVDPATGIDRWAPVDRDGQYGNMAVANGLIFSNSAGAVQIRAKSNGALLAPFWCPPTLARHTAGSS